MSAPETPGPWRARHRCVDARSHDDQLIGLGWEIEGPPRPLLRGTLANAADAYLAASAPVLRDALVECASELEDEICEMIQRHEKRRYVEHSLGVLRRVRAALAASRGEAAPASPMESDFGRKLLAQWKSGQ